MCIRDRSTHTQKGDKLKNFVHNFYRLATSFVVFIACFQPPWLGWLCAALVAGRHRAAVRSSHLAKGNKTILRGFKIDMHHDVSTRTRTHVRTHTHTHNLFLHTVFVVNHLTQNTLTSHMHIHEHQRVNQPLSIVITALSPTLLKKIQHSLPALSRISLK